jgi:hypothetical protein
MIMSKKNLSSKYQMVEIGINRKKNAKANTWIANIEANDELNESQRLEHNRKIVCYSDKS